MWLGVVLYAACISGVEVLSAPFDVALAPDTVIQPDLIVARTADLTERDLPTAPLLAVEVASPSTRGIDLLLKKDRLARAGCPHCWVVDPAAPSVIAWTLIDGEYEPVAEAHVDDEFGVTEPVDVRFTPASLID